MEYDDFIAAGLYDPEAPNAEQRRELLDHLLSRFERQAILDLASTPNPARLGVLLNAPDPPKVSAVELAARTSLPVEQIVAARRAMGFSVEDVDADAIDENFAATATIVALGSELYGQTRALGTARVIGTAVRMIVDAARAMFVDTITEAKATELEMSQASEAATAAWELVIGAVGQLMREHLTMNSAYVFDLLAGDLRKAVAFVDLVDSVSWAGRLSAQDHADALTRFEGAAHEFAADNCSRVVKFIGDEVMIVADEPAAACAAATELCHFVASDPCLPTARGGVNFGLVTSRYGDFFGPVVDLAARMTKLAHPHSVLVTHAVAERVESATAIGAFAVRGFAEPVELFELATSS